jgi:hypothetical protein
MKSLQALLVLLSLLVLPACGSGLNTYHSEGLEQEGLIDGILTIPASGVSSGRSYINALDSGYYIDLDGSDPAAISYLNQLSAREISVSRTEVSGAILYSIRFSGVWDEGPCPFASSNTCSRIKLRVLVAY